MFPTQQTLISCFVFERYQQKSSGFRKPKRNFRRRDKEKEAEEEWNYQAWLRSLEGR
jgi:hypothetical protein